ncbi:MAG: hypothetical protein ABW044_01480 [Cellvibrio sp.]
MKWFRCLVEGRDFPGVLIEQTSPVGFYTTRFVEAKTAEDAEVVVLTSLRVEKALTLPNGYLKPANAKVFFNEITEVDVLEVPKQPSGFTFYVMGT